MRVSRLNRVLVCFAVTMAMGITLSSVAEARGVKPRSTSGAQRYGASYFANAPQYRAPVQYSAPVVVCPPGTVAVGEAVVRQSQPSASQRGIVSRGQVVPGSERVISERVLPSTATAAQPVVTPPVQTPVSAPQATAVGSPQ